MKIAFKKISIYLGVWSIGVLFGGILTFMLFAKFQSDFYHYETKVKSHHEILMPYLLLHKLRQNENEAAINQLELKLDDGLFNIAYMLDNTDFKIDPATKQTLNKIRKYRKKYPRTYTSDDYKQKISALLER